MEEFKNNGTLNMEEFQEDLKQLFEQWKKYKESQIPVKRTLSKIKWMTPSETETIKKEEEEETFQKTIEIKPELTEVETTTKTIEVAT